jgi:hypothetical protein
MARIYNRKEGVINYESGVQKQLELSRNYHVQRYLLTLEVNTTTTAGAVFNSDNNLFKLIETLQLVANGSLNIKFIKGEKLVYNYILNNGNKPYTKIDTGVSKTATQIQSAYIDLVIPNEVRPQDTILFTKIFSSLYLNVVWADASVLGMGITINSAKLSVDSEQLIGYARKKDERINYFKEVQQVENITSDGTNKYIKLDPNQFYTGFLLVVKNGAALTDDILKNIRIKSGTTIFSDTSADTIKRINENAFKLPNLNFNKGLYYLDFTVRDKLSDMLNTVQNAGGFNTLELEVDLENTSASSVLDIYPEYVEITNTYEV